MCRALALTPWSSTVFWSLGKYMHRSTKEIDENINKNQKLNDRELLSICATLLFTWYYSNHAVTTAASRLSFLATGDFWSTVCPQGPLKQQELLSRLFNGRLSNTHSSVKLHHNWGDWVLDLRHQTEFLFFVSIVVFQIGSLISVIMWMLWMAFRSVKKKTLFKWTYHKNLKQV